VEITGLQKYRNVGESQPVLIMIDPVISTRTRYQVAALMVPEAMTTQPREDPSVNAASTDIVGGTEYQLRVMAVS
jgi:hypothetical protein